MPTTKPTQPTSEFSVELSRHLRNYIEETDGLSVRLVAATMGRSINYVYDRTSGLRPPDTDILATVARLAGTDVRALMLNLMGRMMVPAP